MEFDNQIQFMKDLLKEERGKREQQLEEQFKMYSQMQGTV